MFMFTFMISCVNDAYKTFKIKSACDFSRL